MRYFAHGASFVLALTTGGVYAADANGYTAQYECRAGNPNCNVDVANYVSRTCDATISTSDSASNISSKLANNQIVCVLPGDYTSKGTITLPNSGTSGAYKVLRYGGSDTNDPWRQSKPAVLKEIVTSGRSYWIIHRLSFNQRGNSGAQIDIRNSSSNIIVDRSYFTNFNDVGVSFSDNSISTLQNSLIENGQRVHGIDVIGVSICNATNNRIVNNEIRDAGSAALQVAECSQGVPGTVIENNDLYFSNAVYTDCHGNFTPSNPNAPCAAGESILTLKDGGTSSNPIKVIHNRAWGARENDMNVCCTGGGGAGLSSVGGGAANVGWVLYQHNIVGDSQFGFTWTTWHGGNAFNQSVIGNLIYGIKPYKSDLRATAFDWGGLGGVHKTEFYFNTITASDGFFAMGNNSDLDVRCNAVLDTKWTAGTMGSHSQAAYNAYFNAATLVVPSVNAVNIVRSSASESLNGQYCYTRQLRTHPQTVCVQAVKPALVSPHSNACDSTIGSRPGIGISDNGLLL